MMKQALFSLSFVILFSAPEAYQENEQKILTVNAFLFAMISYMCPLETSKVKYMDKNSIVDIIADFLFLKLHHLILLLCHEI